METGRLRKLATAHRQRFVLLQAMLMLLFVLPPFLEGVGGARSKVTEFVTFGMFSAMMLLTIYAVAGTRYAIVVGISLALPSMLTWAVGLSIDSRWIDVTQYAFSAAFVGYASVIILVFVFRSERVTANTVAASLCVYLLLATCFSQVYGIMENLHPDTFELSGTEPDGQPLFSRERPATALYFSLTTMSTLGYGDIVPRTPSSRMMSSMQAVVGQMYLAVLVARFVGLHIAHSRWDLAKPTDEPD